MLLIYILLFLVNFVVCITCPPEYLDRCETCDTLLMCVKCNVGFWNPSSKCSYTCVTTTCTCTNHTDCLSCKDGYYGIGNNCDQNCSSGCNGKTCKNDGTCSCKPNFTGIKCDSCVDDKYGGNCSMQCSRGCEGNNCSLIDGSCTCREYYSGVKCENCSANRYGEECSKPCSLGCLDTCSSTDGKCDCKEFYTGDKCETCEDGRYGEGNCDQKCSSGCNSVTCNPNGSCTCKPDFTGSTCNTCVAGKYGSNCSLQCSRGCEGITCSSLNGTCSCRSNYSGEQCENCIAGRYGEDCSNTCSLGCLDNTCSPDGKCDCKALYTGDKCDVCVYGRYDGGCLNASARNEQTEIEKTKVGAVVGGVIGAVIVVVAAVLAVIILKRRNELCWNKPQGEEQHSEEIHTTQPVVYATVQKNRHSSVPAQHMETSQGSQAYHHRTSVTEHAETGNKLYEDISDGPDASGNVQDNVKQEAGHRVNVQTHHVELVMTEETTDDGVLEIDDDTRIKLRDCETDYINASFIDVSES
ncbi:multiple epidermal growth factor-like domains protein 10 [Mya arenaria]|uniref:multiple epidermal growth factor-like domains protein 10 n=1 Tax=Mya arenaria TaxID=6604 RepID=UPI0022E4B483|nr:multiple epidermal growth factor-like domains protein 10 [Mya arenaria]